MRYKYKTIAVDGNFYILPYGNGLSGYSYGDGYGGGHDYDEYDGDGYGSGGHYLPDGDGIGSGFMMKFNRGNGDHDVSDW